jgi:hypothetical protein
MGNTQDTGRLLLERRASFAFSPLQDWESFQGFIYMVNRVVENNIPFLRAQLSIESLNI